jgi:hypothetical protein
MGLRDVDLRVLLGAQVQSLVAPDGQVELLEPLGGHAVQEASDRDDSRLLEGIDLCRGDARSLHGIDHAGLDGDPVQRAGLVSVGVEEQRVVGPGSRPNFARNARSCSSRACSTASSSSKSTARAC